MHSYDHTQQSAGLIVVVKISDNKLWSKFNESEVSKFLSVFC
jgi:hypothetical protein